MTQKEIIKLARANGTLREHYEKEVNKRVRAKYSESGEMAILRHHALDPERYTKEWNEYNSYIEECKRQAKALLEM